MKTWNPLANWNQPLTRRSVLRGAGAVLALPFLESWASHLARAAGEKPASVKPPLRMGIFTVTGGTVLESWKMPSAGPLAKLPSILRPLEPLKDDLLVLTGLSHDSVSEGLNGHEYCGYMHLTGAPRVGKAAGKPYSGISVDQAAARHCSRDTFFPSLEFGLANQETRYSFRSTDEWVPYESDPRLVFERMFRGRKPIVPNWSRRTQARAALDVRNSAKSDSYDRKVVDSVLDEAKNLRGRISSGDQQKLDQYLEAVHAIEDRIERFESLVRLEALDAADPGPSKIVMPNLPPKNAPFHKLLHLVHTDPEKHGDFIHIMSDLMVLAFQTDTTRVVTMAIGDDGAQFPGVVTVGYETHAHTLEHQGNAGRVEDADPISREGCRQIHAWYTSFFAEMAAKMKAIDEGGSNLLDNSMLLYTSYMADGGHGTQDYPVALLGKAGGTLRGGRQIDFQKKTPMANLYVEMLQRMGMKIDTFGNSKTSKNAAYDGKLPGLV